MDAFVKVVGGIVLGFGGLFLIILMGTLCGGVAGWTVGLVFVDTMVEIKQWLGVSVTNFELGAMLGFVGGFFRGRVSTNDNTT